MNHSLKKIMSRASAFVLAVAMGVTSANTHFFGLGDKSGLTDNFSASAATIIEANKTYYDSGTMILNGYYHAVDESLSDVSDEYNKNWQTSDVVSYVQDSDVTLPGTTSINDTSIHTMMCWADYLDDTNIVDYAVSGALWGKEDANHDGNVDGNDVGMIYNYIAKGTTTVYSADKVKIKWEIKAWRAWDEEHHTYVYPDDLGLTNRTNIAAEWTSNAIFNANAPKWMSNNTNWSDWRNYSCAIGSSTSNTVWARVRTLPYGYTNLVADGLGGMAAQTALDGFFYEPNPGERVYSESDTSYRTDNMLVYEHVCDQFENGQRCTHNYNNLTTISGGITTYPVYSFSSMLSQLWSESKKALYKKYKNDANDPKEVTSFRLYNMNITPYVNANNPSSAYFNKVRTYRDGNIVPSKNVNFTTVNGCTSIASIADLFSFTDIYSNYNNGLKTGSATVTSSHVGNTRQEFMYDVILNYDVSFDYQRSGGKIESILSVPNVVLDTVAKDIHSNSHVGSTIDGTGIIDNVDITMSAPGEETTLVVKGQIYEVGANGRATIINGLSKQTEVTFAAGDTHKNIDMTFNFVADSSYAGKTLVVYERVYDKATGALLAAHEDPTDDDQIIRYPKITTSAVDLATGTHYGRAMAGSAIKDTVTYSNLIAGKTYVLKGTLMQVTPAGAADGEVPAVTTNEVVFTPLASTGTQTVNFTFDSSAYDGKKVVVYEKLYLRDGGDTTITSHEDITDANQTVAYDADPFTVDTQAQNTDNGNTQIGMCTSIAHIADVVTLGNILDNLSYTITGQIYLVETDGSVSPLLINGSPVTTTVSRSRGATANHIPNEDVVVNFSFDATGLAGKTIVIYETVTESGTGRQVKHDDPTDVDQMIYYPGIDTVATDKVTGTHTGTAEAGAIVVDQVTLTNLVPNIEYKLEGTLKYVDSRNRTGNVAITPVTKTFTPTTTTYNVTMELPFDATDYHKNNIIVCQSLKSSGGTATFVTHADITDADQTVYYKRAQSSIQIETDAVDTISSIQSGVCRVNDGIRDTITYSNADPLITYTAVGELYEITPSGLVVPVLAGNVPISATTRFKPTATQGVATVTFSNIDSSSFAGKTLVVYEYIYEGTDQNSIIFGDPVAWHEDPTDTRQMIFYPAIDTVAVDKISGTHIGNLSTTSVIEDTVTYSNLVPGVKYTLTGSLMTRDSSGRIVALRDASNNTITVSQDFTPTNANGIIKMQFTFDSTKYADSNIVVYEQLMIPGTNITYVSHSDITDADQTVTYRDTTVVIETDAVNKFTMSHISKPRAADTIIDTITYKNLIPNTDYVAIGTLYERMGNNGITVVKNNNIPVTSIVNFTPISSDGTVEVMFNFDSQDYMNKTIVVYEQIYLASNVANGIVTGAPVAVHEDPTDTRQQVRYTLISTLATDMTTGSNTGYISKDATIVDRVYYSGLEVGKTYEVVGSIYNASTGLQVSERAVGGRSNHTMDGFGNITNKTQFIPTSTDGYVDVSFRFDSTPYAGKDLVVFETLYRIDPAGAVEIASHKDLDDENQTISYSTVDTNVFATDTDSQLAPVDIKVDITDTVHLKNLVIGETYTIKGSLVTSAGKPVDKSDVEFTFVADEEDCTKYLEYKVNTSAYAGGSLVAVVNLYVNDALVCEHKDLEDKDQTIYICDIETVASAQNGGKFLDPIADETIIDEVRYTSLVVGNRYRLVADVVDKTTGKIVSTDYHTFTAKEADDVIKMTISDVDLRSVAGKQVVIFQTLYDITENRRGVKIMSLENLDDANETLTVKETTVETELVDAETGLKVVNTRDDIALKDSIKYTNLVPGNSYVVVSTLVDKDTGKTIKDEAGNETIIKSGTLVAKDTTAECEANFTFKNIDLAGKTVVAFNDLYRVDNGRYSLVVSEHDLSNKNQTVTFTLNPVITTEATDANTGSHTISFTSSAKINDRVTYKGLKSGDTYDITATVYDKSTNAPVAEIAPVKKSFKADAQKGYVDVVIPIDATQFSGKTFVIFEKITQNGNDIAAHEDIEDADQTVYINKIETVLTAGNRTSKTVSAATRVVLVDVINFEGLTPGKTYQIVGHILDKENSILDEDVTSESATINADGEAELIIDGNEGSKVTNGRKIIATKTISFTPTTSKGSVAMEFTVNTSTLKGHHLVAFETIIDKNAGVVVGEHKDINSASQTVTVKSSTTVYTGDLSE